MMPGSDARVTEALRKPKQKAATAVNRDSHGCYAEVIINGGPVRAYGVNQGEAEKALARILPGVLSGRPRGYSWRSRE